MARSFFPFASFSEILSSFEFLDINDDKSDESDLKAWIKDPHAGTENFPLKCMCHLWSQLRSASALLPHGKGGSLQSMRRSATLGCQALHALLARCGARLVRGELVPVSTESEICMLKMAMFFASHIVMTDTESVGRPDPGDGKVTSFLHQLQSEAIQGLVLCLRRLGRLTGPGGSHNAVGAALMPASDLRALDTLCQAVIIHQTAALGSGTELSRPLLIGGMLIDSEVKVGPMNDLLPM